MSNNFTITKATGEQEKYSSDKLCSSLIQSGAPEKLANNICHMVEKDLTPAMTTKQIWRKALRYLIKSDLHDVSARYSLRRAMANLGPDGYVFEKYIATVLEAHGYQTKVNQMIRGASGVEHEIDVLATKKGITSFIEVKYKNEYGLRTHVDTVMYSWARYFDILETKPTSQRDKFEIWLVTNTEFTSSSIMFGTHRDMRLLGWDYPDDISLEDMIAQEKLYPISILPSLTLKDRKALVREGLILAQDLLPYSARDLEDKFAISPKRSGKLIAEARELSMIDDE